MWLSFKDRQSRRQYTKLLTLKLCQGMLTIILKGEVSLRLTSSSLLDRNQLHHCSKHFFSISKRPSPNEKGQGGRQYLYFPFRIKVSVLCQCKCLVACLNFWHLNWQLRAFGLPWRQSTACGTVMYLMSFPFRSSVISLQMRMGLPPRDLTCSSAFVHFCKGRKTCILLKRFSLTEGRIRLKWETTGFVVAS